MVLAATANNVPKLQALADKYQTEMFVFGKSDGTGILKIWHEGNLVVELDCQRLHEAPRQHRKSTWQTPTTVALPKATVADPMALTTSLQLLLSDFAIVSREPIIREYDHQVQGNTLLMPLAGATGDAPQDGSVVRVDGSPHLIALACSLLPEWGKTAPYEMGAAVVDECFRQLVAVGADPDQIAILDNFCMGNPDDQTELGALVESVKGMTLAAETYGAPFVSGKDSFYNYFLTDEGPVSIPVTALVSGMGIVKDATHIVGSSLRKADSVLCLLGNTTPELGGSVYARVHDIKNQAAPATDAPKNLANYRAYHTAIQAGLILSTHDVSEGGLAVAAAEMGFSLKGGMELEIPSTMTADEFLFSESPGRFLMEISPINLAAAQQALPGLQVLGKATAEHQNLKITGHGKVLIDEALTALKAGWKSGLTKFY
jgi:phosphoribosylformylglycinamidine synthase